MRVLILEDDPLIALDLQAIVEDEGHEVVAICPSLAGGRAHLGADVEFALIDIDLTDGKGFELASALSERRIPFAFVSAAARREVPPHLRDAEFIRKPFQEAAVLRSLPQRPSKVVRA